MILYQCGWLWYHRGFNWPVKLSLPDRGWRRSTQLTHTWLKGQFWAIITTSCACVYHIFSTSTLWSLCGPTPLRAMPTWWENDLHGFWKSDTWGHIEACHIDFGVRLYLFEALVFLGLGLLLLYRYSHMSGSQVVCFLCPVSCALPWPGTM